MSELPAPPIRVVERRYRSQEDEAWTRWAFAKVGEDVPECTAFQEFRAATYAPTYDGATPTIPPERSAILDLLDERLGRSP